MPFAVTERANPFPTKYKYHCMGRPMCRSTSSRGIQTTANAVARYVTQVTRYIASQFDM